MKSFFKKNSTLEAGFTLVEALIAISIFITSILALLSILGNGIANTNYAKQKIVASYLAGEGVERVRNMRDTLVLFHSGGAEAGWGEFKGLVSPGCDDACYLNDVDAFVVCSGVCPALFYHTNTGKYDYTNDVDAVNSGYIRSIKAEKFGDDEIKISSFVSWTQGSGAQEIIFSESLFNWIE